MDATQWAMLLGALALTCWMGAGFTAVLGTDNELRKGETGKGIEFITLVLTGAGAASAIAMATAMVLT